MNRAQADERKTMPILPKAIANLLRSTVSSCRAVAASLNPCPEPMRLPEVVDATLRGNGFAVDARNLSTDFRTAEVGLMQPK